VTTESRFTVSELTTQSDGRDQAGPGDAQAEGLVEVAQRDLGKGPTAELAARLSRPPMSAR